MPERKKNKKVGNARYQHFIPLKEQEGIIGKGIKGSQKGQNRCIINVKIPKSC